MALHWQNRQRWRTYFPLKIRNWPAILQGIGVPILVAVLVAIIGKLLGLTSYQNAFNGQILSTLIFTILIVAGEEFCWRGYLHNKLNHLKHLPLIIGIIWVIWVIWHIVPRTNFDFNSVSVINQVSFAILVIFMSYFLAYLRKKSESVIPAILFHGVWNFFAFRYFFADLPNMSLFSVSTPLATMEGLLGLLVCTPILVPYVFFWYKNFEKNKHLT